ncbi:hypothetical protein Tco_0837095 [Tanacetum coccineum]
MTKRAKGRLSTLLLKVGIMKQKFQRNCYNSDQPSLRAANWQLVDWRVDSRATYHVCADKSTFHSFRAVKNG